MTYCLGIVTKRGLVMASDSRSNAGADQVNTVRKMHTFVCPGERAFILLSSGSLSLTQSIVHMLRRDFDKGKGLAECTSMYDAARIVGEEVRRIAAIDRAALEKDSYPFNVHLLLGGQIKGEAPALYMIYPQGNPLMATEDCPFLQVGETKYGRPILDRGISYYHTSLEEAVKYALLSLDSTMKSNVTVGPPIDLVAYWNDELNISCRRRFEAQDPDFMRLGQRWQQAIRQSVQKLPGVRFAEPGHPAEEPAIQIMEHVSELAQIQQSPPKVTQRPQSS